MKKAEPKLELIVKNDEPCGARSWEAPTPHGQATPVRLNAPPFVIGKRVRRSSSVATILETLENTTNYR